MDRYSILHLKVNRLPHDPKTLAEYARFELATCNHGRPALMAELFRINGAIWDLEADIRQGKEGKLGLAEVGRRALTIRDLNAERIRVKNVIATSLGDFEEVKGQHASELKALSPIAG